MLFTFNFHTLQAGFCFSTVAIVLGYFHQSFPQQWNLRMVLSIDFVVRFVRSKRTRPSGSTPAKRPNRGFFRLSIPLGCPDHCFSLLLHENLLAMVGKLPSPPSTPSLTQDTVMARATKSYPEKTSTWATFGSVSRHNHQAKSLIRFPSSTLLIILVSSYHEAHVPSMPFLGRSLSSPERVVMYVCTQTCNSSIVLRGPMYAT